MHYKIYNYTQYIIIKFFSNLYNISLLSFHHIDVLPNIIEQCQRKEKLILIFQYS